MSEKAIGSETSVRFTEVRKSYDADALGVASFQRILRFETRFGRRLGAYCGAYSGLHELAQGHQNISQGGG